MNRSSASRGRVPAETDGDGGIDPADDLSDYDLSDYLVGDDDDGDYDDLEEDAAAKSARLRRSASASPRGAPAPAPPPNRGAPRPKKFAKYGLETDDRQDDKAAEILLCSAARPHMRAFHCAWWSYFVSFFVWFAVVPILPYMADTLQLTNQQIWNSGMAGIGWTIAARYFLGPLCDVLGPRILVTSLLCIFSIPVALTGLVRTASGLQTLRSFIGILGGTFVVCEYWCSRMFAKQVVGTAKGLAAGWGQVGQGVTGLVMGSVLMPLFIAMFGGNTELAWRTVRVVPAAVAFVTGLVVYNFSDDAPKGNYDELRLHGQFPNPQVTAWGSLKAGTWNRNSWIMFAQYAACFGVELTMDQAVALYFRDVFGQSTEASQAIANIFGWLNLFARGMGGLVSDWANSRWGMRGRLWAQTLMLLAEGAMVFVFWSTTTLAWALVTLVGLSLFVQLSEGTNMAIVPYIDPLHMGTVTGLTGAGGNVGALVFGLCFRTLSYDQAFWIMGCCVLASSFLSVFVSIPGYAGLLWGQDRPVNQETGEVLCSKRSTQSERTQSITAGSGSRG